MTKVINVTAESFSMTEMPKCRNALRVYILPFFFVSVNCQCHERTKALPAIFFTKKKYY
jgi:hypothetical protein